MSYASILVILKNKINCARSIMDSMSDSGSDDRGSNPFGRTDSLEL
jgi:hypothetical protein